jgi:hypothetical protein
MTLAEFKRSLSKAEPPPQLVPALAALWWAAKDDWQRAHELVMNERGRDCAWVHAHLHRVEGDHDNARYWYGRARRPVARGPLRAEWDAIAAEILAKG